MTSKCPVCGTGQVVLSGKISGHMSKRGSRWSACPGAGSAVTSDRLPQCPYLQDGRQCELRIHPMDVTHCFPPAALKSCFECGAPCDGTLTAEDEMSGTDVPVCVTCHPMLTLVTSEGCCDTEPQPCTAHYVPDPALAGNIDPAKPGHGDMTRCTPDAPCGDAGCEFCTADAEWHERYPVEDMDSAPQITEDGCPTPGRCSDAYDDFSLCAPMFPTAVLRQTFHGTAGMTPEDWTSVVRPAVPTHYAHHYTRG